MFCREWSVLCLLAGISFLGGCEGTDAHTSIGMARAVEMSHPPADIPVPKLTEGGGKLATRAYEVYRTPEEYGAAYNAVYQGSSSHPLPPEIDFDSNIVLGLFMGGQPSSGYHIGIGSIDDYPDKVVVNVNLVVPQNCIVTGAFSYPYEFSHIPITPKAIVFTETIVVAACDERCQTELPLLKERFSAEEIRQMCVAD